MEEQRPGPRFAQLPARDLVERPAHHHAEVGRLVRVKGQSREVSMYGPGDGETRHDAAVLCLAEVTIGAGAQGHRVSERPGQLGALLFAEIRTEMEHRFADIVVLEINLATVEVHEPSGHEATLLE